MMLLLASVFAAAPLTASASDAPSKKQEIYTPWFTGPLLAPSATNAPPSHPSFSPSVTVFNTYGRYSSDWSIKKQDNIWAINPIIDAQIGITDNFGVETLISAISNFQKGQSATHFQDLTALFGYQVSNDIKDSWVPDFRLILQEIFPTGKYQNFSSDKQNIDSTGSGSFQTGPNLAFRKLFYLPHNFFSLRGSINYLFPSHVHVKGFNTYGGGHGTKGKVKPGQNITAYLSGEYSINQHWVFAFDTEYFFQKKSRFSGKNGATSAGIATTGLPSSVQISFAPEFEYNFSSESGLLAGAWFTIAGRNSAAFGSAFIQYSFSF